MNKTLILNLYFCFFFVKISLEDSHKTTKHPLVLSFYKSITDALLHQGQKALQTKNILSFYYKVLTYFEETMEQEHFMTILSLLMSQSSIPTQSLYDIEFWNQNLNKAHYFPSFMSLILARLVKSHDGKEESLIHVLSNDELSFCMKGLHLILRMKFLQEGNRNGGNQDHQIEYMLGRLTKIYNTFEKLKMAVLNVLLNRRYILLKLESSNEAEKSFNESLIKMIILQIQGKESSSNVVFDLLEIQTKLFKILVTKENSNSSTRVSSVTVNNKFYKLLYQIVLKALDVKLTNDVSLRKSIQEFVGSIFANKEYIEENNFRKEIQSSIS